ncbi:MAG: 5'/3'-nucleotidase SurE [Planctomycetaceae bacterium]|nr:5'/3'-nucleotidase SurE [Planctomycetaceae bacterium]
MPRSTALLTNDDGYGADGLELLIRVVSRHADVVVIAPHQHLSGCGHQVTVDQPLTLKEIEPNRYSLDGTPADCVRVGVTHLVPNVDWVLSGVNEGGNLGVDVFTSGTVAAVREAAILGKRAIAFSKYRASRRRIQWDAMANDLDRVLQQILALPLSDLEYLNVNFPDRADDETPELVDCPLDPSRQRVAYELVEDQLHYRGIYQDRPRQSKTDVDVCFAGDIALTRLRVQ